MQVRSILIFLAFLLPAISVNAQSTSQVIGQVFSKLDSSALTGASVMVLRLKDSIVLKSVISSKDGSFSINHLPINDSLIVTVTSVGFLPFSGLISLRNKRFVMQAIWLDPVSVTLSEVSVTARYPLVIIKEDTIEYKASSFKTPPNSKAEDIVKRIPGLIIDESGKIIYNGRPVSKILVNGQVFFAENGILALQNIPVELIDKIQLSDGRSVEERIGGSDRHLNSHTMNIKLKNEDLYMGGVAISRGTNSRYDFSGFASMSNHKTRVSIASGVNNVNRAGNFPSNKISIITSGKGGGITRTWGGAFDFFRKIGDKLDMRAGYQFNRPVTTKEEIQEMRQSFLNDTIITNNSYSLLTNRSEQHEVSIEAVNSQKIRITERVNFIRTDNNTVGRYNTHVNNEYLSNDQETDFSTTGSSLASTTSFLFNPISNRRDKLQINGHFRYLSSLSTDLNNAFIRFYKAGVVDSTFSLNQEMSNKNINADFFSVFKYLHMFDSSFSIQLKQHTQQQWDIADKNAFNLFNLSKERDDLLSNSFRNRSFFLISEATLRYTINAWEIESGAQLLNNQAERNDLDNKLIIRQKLFRLLPVFQLSRFKSLSQTMINFKYMANYAMPSASQLQPVVNNTNPLFEKLGNPNLKPQGSHQFTLELTKFRPTKKISGTDFSFNVELIEDKIVPSTFYDIFKKQYLQYKNAVGVYEIGSVYSITWTDKLLGGKLVLNPYIYGSFKYDKSFLDQEEIVTKTFSMIPSIVLKYQREQTLSLELNYRPIINKVSYSQSVSADQEYTIQNVSGSIEAYFFDRLKCLNSLTVSHNNQLPQNFDRTSLLWNASVSFLCFKNRKGEIRASAFDILKQNRNIERTVGSNYIQDSQANNLLRYLMLGFTYNFSGKNTLLR